MSKGLGFVIFIFIALVGLNLLWNLGAALLPPLPGSVAAAGSTFAAPLSVDAADFKSNGPGNGTGPFDLPFVNVNLFAANGVGRSYITQGYGHTAYAYLYIDGWHNGVDFAANFGAPVYSPASGVVLATVNQDEYCPHIAFGEYAAVDDTTNHLVLVFSHLGNFAVTPGEQITKGTLIGDVGPTGLETGPHLLLSIFQEQGFSTSTAHGCGPYPQGHDVNPLNYLGSLYN
jgi:murein DD-endopeptidase MepM/ murein hydrolase activator NlpD